MSIRFEQPELFHLLWVVAALAVAGLVTIAWRRRALQRFAPGAMWSRLAPAFSRVRPYVRLALAGAALAALVVAIADPRWGSHWQELPRRGIDVIFVLDVSRSMQADDLQPTRLERAKADIRDMVSAMAGDRVGLVTFAGTASLAVPITANYGAFKLALDEAGPSRVARGGSLLGDAIRLAANSFVDKVKAHKAIVVFTDGEDQDSFPVEAAGRAYDEQGIRVYTVGLGDAAQGSRVPLDPQRGGTGYLRYHDAEVWSKMNASLLEKTALAGGGAYVPVGTRSVDMTQVYRDTINQLDKGEFERGKVEKFHPQYQWFAAAALLLLLVETVIRDYRTVRPAGKGVVTT